VGRVGEEMQQSWTKSCPRCRARVPPRTAIYFLVQECQIRPKGPLVYARGSVAVLDITRAVLRRKPGLRFALALLIVLPAFSQVQRDIAALESRPSLGAWQRTHPGERFEPAHYETSNDGYEVDYARRNRWCAASIRQTGNLTRAALFYVPVPASGALPALPAGGDPGLTRACELDAIWYESRNGNDFGSLVRELSASWGEPNGASSEPDIAGWALWKNRSAWHRSGLDIWVATKPGNNGPHQIVYGRRNMPRDWDVMDRWFGSVMESQTLVAQEAARIAALDSALTTRILSGSRCGAGPAERDAVAVAWTEGDDAGRVEHYALGAAAINGDAYPGDQRLPMSRQ